MAGPSRQQRAPRRARTRGRYVSQEQEAQQQTRGSGAKRVQREAFKRWSTWTAGNKLEYINHLDGYEQAEREIIAQEARIDEAGDLLNDARVRGVTLQPYRGAVLQAVTEQQTIIRRLHTEAQWLLGFYQYRRCSRALVDAWNETLQRGQRLRQQIATRIDEAQQERDEPEPVYQITELVYNASGDGHLVRPYLGHWTDPYPPTTIPSRQGSTVPWAGPYALYNDTYTLITAWIRENNGQILDTIVRKDAYLAREWWDISRWSDWTEVNDITSRVPNELVIHQAMMDVSTSSLPGTSNILPLLHSGLDNQTRILTLYTELAAYGSLDKLIESHRESTPALHIPEPFIWYVFLVLVECGLAMQYGQVPAADAAHPMVPGWEGIVHRDIKPSNVFLCAPNPQVFPDYPAPKLGDFGTAVKTSNNDPLNPELYADGEGTQRFRAPEQRAFKDRTTYHRVNQYKLGAHTNVYAIGMVVREMMLASHDDARDVQEPVGDEDDQIWPGLLSEYLRLYSTDLTDLINECLRMHPAERTGLRELHERICNQFIGRNEVFPVLPDLYHGHASATTTALNGIYRSEEGAGDLRPERGGDARLRLGPRRPGEVTRALFLLQERRPREENDAVGYRDSWRRDLRSQDRQ